MGLYCGLDLHSTNTYAFVGDAEDREVLGKRLPNRLESILSALEPYRDDLVGVAVESTFNWYWLVDGLIDSGYRANLVNTSAVRRYEGLKFTDDRHDARWLAHLLRLGVLPTGYIYPKEERPVRDLLRKRVRLVQQRTTNRLSLQNILARNTGEVIKGERLKTLTTKELSAWLEDETVVLAVESTLEVIGSLCEQIDRIERAALERARLKPAFKMLKSIPGVGDILALTIMYETGDIGRFPGPGNYASYCRCVESQRRSNDRKKGDGNRKNGNPFLSWAFSEAATFAIRYQPQARRFYERKRTKTNLMVANRSLAHKLARASYFMLRDQVPYNATLLFG